MQEPSEPPWPPFRFQDRPARRHPRHHGRRWQDQDAFQDRPEGQDRPDWRSHFRRQGHGDGNPLRRDPDDRIGGGIAAGIGTWRGFSPTTVRIACVVAALVTTGWAVPIYFIGWLAIPARGSATSIWAKARHDSQGVGLAIGAASVVAVFLLLAGVLNDGAIEVYGWPQVVSVACLVLIWRDAPEGEKAGLQHLVAPLESLGGGGDNVRRGTKLRFVVSAVLLIAGIGVLVGLHAGLTLLAPLGGFLLVVAGIVVLPGPVWLRISGAVVLERQARAGGVGGGR